MARVVITQSIYDLAAISYEHYQAWLPKGIYAGGGQCDGLFNVGTAVNPEVITP